MKKIIIASLILCMVLPTIIALNNNPTIAPNGECYVEEPILLKSGWNIIALTWNNGSYPLTGDRNVSISQDYNLLGNSGVRGFKTEDITFTNATGIYDFENSGLTEIKVLRDKTASSTSLEEDYIINPKWIYPQEGFWINSNSDGNITLPNIGGSVAGQSYGWSKLRLSNGTDEKTISEARSDGWFEGYVQYWDTDERGFRYVCSSIGIVGGSADCLKDSMELGKGYFIKSNYDDISLIRDNSTERCKQKFPKCNNNNGDNRCKPKFYNNQGNSKGKIKFFKNHIWRLIGSIKNKETF